LQAQQKTIAALQEYAQTNPDEMSELCLAIRNYFNIIEKHNLRDWVIEHQPYSLVNLLGRCMLALFGIPFWVLGMLFNYAPYKLSALASCKVKDPQFVSSVQFVAGLVFYPVYYSIMIALFVILIPSVLGKFIAPLLMIPLGLLTFRYYLSIKKLCVRFRFLFSKNPELIEAIELRKIIFEKMEKLKY